jgi:pimeloyl-ACP methyl ester carboxylesterase
MPFLSRPGVELYHEFSGDGVPVLLIQGIGCVSEAWRPQVEGLSGRHKTLRVVAQQLALNAPGRVKSLVLMCTFARGADGARATPQILWMSLRTRIGTRRMRRRAFLDLIWPAANLRGVDTDALATRISQLVGRDLADNPPILIKQLKALGRHDVFARLNELAQIPTLVMSGEHDPIARQATGRALAAAIPGATFELFHGASHGLPIQHAEAVNQRLVEFFERSA